MSLIVANESGCHIPFQIRGTDSLDNKTLTPLTTRSSSSRRPPRSSWARLPPQPECSPWHNRRSSRYTCGSRFLSSVSLNEILARPYSVITLHPWLEYLKYRILPGALHLGFPATTSTTRSWHFQPVAVNRAVSSHAGRADMTLDRRSQRGDQVCGP